MGDNASGTTKGADARAGNPARVVGGKREFLQADRRADADFSRHKSASPQRIGDFASTSRQQEGLLSGLNCSRINVIVQHLRDC